MLQQWLWNHYQILTDYWKIIHSIVQFTRAWVPPWYFLGETPENMLTSFSLCISSTPMNTSVSIFLSFFQFFLYLLKIQVQMKGADAWLAPPDTAHALADKLNQQTLQGGRGQKYCPWWYMRGTSFPENHDLGEWFMQETFVLPHPTMHIFQFQIMLSYIKHLFHQ